MEEHWRAELERLFDIVVVERTPEGPVYFARYWEDDGELDVKIYPERHLAEVVLKHINRTERFQIAPLHRLQARTARRPHRLDLDKPRGGRLTLWFKPLGYSIGGRL
jgi:hypothetical protein